MLFYNAICQYIVHFYNLPLTNTKGQPDGRKQELEKTIYTRALAALLTSKKSGFYQAPTWNILYHNACLHPKWQEKVLTEFSLLEYVVHSNDYFL